MDHRSISDTWERGSAYERYIGRWSRHIAPHFLAWLNIPPGQRWLDVGCGTGALCATIIDRCFPGAVAGVEPSDGFLKTATENLSGQAALYRGSATAIPLDDASVDVVVSGCVLNFVPDPRAALVEMARVSRGNGTIAAYVWDYADKMEPIRLFWDSARELDPQAAALDEARRFALCKREALDALFANANLQDIETKAIDIPALFEDFDDYWQPFLGGQGPAPAYAMSLSEDARNRLRNRLYERLAVAANGSISLTARAWAVRATAPAQ